MKKIIIIALVLVLILVVLATVLLAKTENKILDQYSHTKAICDKDNYCQDYYIICKRDKMVTMTPLTGAAIQFGSDWEDPRSEEQKKLC